MSAQQDLLLSHPVNVQTARCLRQDTDQPVPGIFSMVKPSANGKRAFLTC
jgi:hypothetical protein